jgi:putative tryptophan/tyrosine transport system substrate-binding protein
VDTPPTQAAQKSTKAIPIVIAVSADPVRAGLVASLAHPGGNTTGFALLAPETDQKALGLLKEILPNAKRLAMIFDPNNQGMMLRVEALRTATAKLALKFQSIEATDSSELGSVLSRTMKSPPDALFVLSPIYAAYRNEITEFAAKAKVPLCFDTRALAGESGSLLSYGADISDLFRKAAIFVDKILKGAKPMDLPVEQPTKFEMVINLKTAKFLNLPVPSTLLALADEVIE